MLLNLNNNLWLLIVIDSWLYNRDSDYKLPCQYSDLWVTSWPGPKYIYHIKEGLFKTFQIISLIDK